MSELTQRDIARKCDAVKNLLIEKNRKYGDSALEPVRTFSQATAVEQILVRIDDKLSRISRGTGLVGDDEDVIQDLIGYLILLQIAVDRQDMASQKFVSKSLGAVWEGLLRKHRIVKDANRDSTLYAVTNSEWNSTKRARLYKRLYGAKQQAVDAANEKAEHELDERNKAVAKKHA